jgi:hypothetical protein
MWILQRNCNIYFSLIQTHDDNKPLTPNVGIAIIGIFWAIVLYLHFGPFNAICTYLIKQLG